MDAPQEGRAGGARPLPSGSGRGPGPRDGEGPAPRERQAYLPGLGGSEEGWTVFGPEEEEPASGGEAALPPTREAPSDPDTATSVPPTEPAGEAALDGAAPRAAAAPAEPSAAPPRGASEPPALPPAPPAETAADGPPTLGDPSSDPGTERPSTRPRLPLPWAIVLVLALATAATTVLVAHFRGRGTVSAGERPQQAGLQVEPSPEPQPPPPDRAPEVERLERQLAALREELQEARSEAGESQRLREELEATRARLDERLASVEGELGAVLERIEEPPAPAIPAPPPQAAPGTDEASPGPSEAPAPAEETLAERRARGVVRVLAALEGGRTGEALGQLDSLRAREVFPAADPAGSDLLRALARGGLALEAADLDALQEGRLPDRGRLDEAGEHLRRARQQRGTFEEEAGDWLAAGGPPSAAPQRLERVDACLGELEERLAAARAGIEQRHEEDWQWILGLGVPQDPGLVDRHVESFGCDHDEVLLAATVDAWLAHCVWSGEVDPLELAAAQDLRAWGERASARPPQQRNARDVELLWLWNALRWYVDGADPGLFDWRGLDVPEVLAPRDDWRAELRLAVELALPDAGWPPPESRMAIYHVDAPGPARWRVDSVERIEGDGARWHLVRRHFAADGAPLGGGVNVVVERRGQSFSYAGADSALVDLRASGAQVSVAPCPVAAPQELPAMQGVDLFEVEGVVLGSGRAVGTCLVQRDGEWTRWLLPGLGLVREEREGPDGRVRIDLCAVGSTP